MMARLKARLPPPLLLLLVPLVLLAVGVAAYVGRTAGPTPETGQVGPAADALPGGALRSVSPRLVSNETSQPLLVFGSGFEEGVRLLVQGVSEPLETTRIDRGHLTAVLPAGIAAPPHRPFRRIRVGLVGQPEGPSAHIDVVNDVDYPLPYALELSADGQRLFVASPTTDEVLCVDRAGGAVVRVPVGDGPRALARWGNKLLVGHRYEERLFVLDMASPETPPRILNAPGPVERIAVTGDSAFVTSSLTDVLYELDLIGGVPRRSWRAGVNPQAVAAGDGLIAVGSRSTGVVKLLGAEGRSVDVVPDTATQIIGGRTAPFAKYVMGGSYPRALVIERGARRVFVASLGPNIGPNPDRMEISMNGGVGVIDVPSGRFVRHVSLGEGIPQALAYDPGRSLLFAADVSRGRVVVLTAGVRPRRLGAVTLPAPARGAASTAPAVADLATGPWDLRLADGGDALLVLERLTGRVTELDVSGASAGELTVTRSVQVTDLGGQSQRRLGEALYFTDVGRTGMSCDACHPDGHDGGVLFTKGQPMHIYRSPSLRSARESPPYFTPAQFPSLEYTAQRVLGRNRFHKPDPTPVEARALGLYQSTLTAPPSPYRHRASGAIPTRIDLPDGRLGSPRQGLALFEGKGECVRCHPPPQFTTDQAPDSRAKLYDVGTAVALPLRPQMQDFAAYPLPAPSLVGIWDQWPLLHGGLAGASVEGDAVRPTDAFALARVFALDTAGKHGGWAGLSPTEQADLLAFLLML